MPIFPEIRPHLDAAREAANEHDEFIFQAISTQSSTLTGRLDTLCRKANIVRWDKPWQNLRSSRETELVEEFPIHVATARIGNSPLVAAKHYLQITKKNTTIVPASNPK